MIFQIKHNNQRFFGRSFLKIFLVSLLILVFVLVFTVFDFSKTLVANLFSPFLKSGNYIYQTIGQIPSFFSDKIELIKKNDALLNEVENNSINLIEYEVVKNENKKLREDLKIKPIGKLISASVISKFPQIPMDSLFVDRGTVDGLIEGDSVLAGERILVGKIVKISKNSSIVALNSFVDVISYGVVSRTSESIEIKGVGGGNIEAKVPFDFDIVVGDKIIVGGSSDYLVAIVGVVEEDRSAGFKKVLMSLPVYISKINTVFILGVNTD
ncbi:MAG: rod shape-determining protein MreC [Candidatus Paceibacterota bacterium]